MSVFKNPFFFISAAFFWINQGAEKLFGRTSTFISSYSDDLLAMPVILGITLQVFQWIHPLKNQFRFTWVQCLVGFLYVSIAFEGVLPLYSETYTRDYWDIVCYAIGTFGFYKLINPEVRPKIS
ncbi:magnesium citrate secondary transporter [Algoriphagus sp. PAP.12]|uniref:magnesium citrate secondary transporter n=1 Tax=Algoriphagus sp. PAP.12 TaxID=2996678 RepID=UPI00227B8D8E|nr:magnesium citrate secondary transporter [Algoriphagus sp. PAP.12]